MVKLVDRATYSRSLSAEELAAWRAFLRAHRTVLAGLSADLEQAGELGLSEVEVLARLAQARKTGIRLSDLAGKVMLTKSGITRLVDRLVETGLVRRSPCKTDGRVQYAVITATGLERLRAARRVHLPGVARRFVAPLSPSELRTLRTALERIAGAE
ncbi:MAG TPA: MarR family transcriptional regulator [Candidatus Limnocylindria bacterium]|nr:MarR family transcriptional regulator [Candidatus Limnocylindria bacterium]